MGEPPPQPNGSPRENENDQDGCKDPKAVTRHATTMLAVRTRIQERVGVEPLSVVGQVRERDIQQENQHQDRKRQKRMRVRGGEDDFQQGPEGVEAVLRDLQSFIALATLDTHFATLFFFFESSNMDSIHSTKPEKSAYTTAAQTESPRIRSSRETGRW